MTWQASLRLARRWVPLVAAAPILGALLAYGLLGRILPTYQASTTLLVQPAAVGASVDTQALLAAQNLAQTYAEAIHTRSVLSAAAAQVGLGDVPESALKSRVNGRQLANTQLVIVTAEDSDPGRAAALANAVAQVFLSQNAQLEAGRFANSSRNLAGLVDQLQGNVDALTAQVADVNAQPPSPARDTQLAQLQANLAQAQASYGDAVKNYEGLQVSAAQFSNTASVLDPAVPPTDPARPNRTLIVLAAALAALVAAAGIAFISEYMADHLGGADRIASITGLPTLGLLPNSGPRLRLNDLSSREVMANHRLLRAKLVFAMRGCQKYSLLVTSASKGEGKSSVAAILALALAETGQRVILVDADFYRPTLAQLFQVAPHQRGLSTLLAGASEAVDTAAYSTWQPNLLVVPTGPPPAESSALLTPRRVDAALRQLNSLCDVLVVDSPPVLRSPDAALLSQHVDGVLFVVDASRTRAREAAAAVEMLRGLGGDVVGAVVNRVDKGSIDYLPTHASSAGYTMPVAFPVESRNHDAHDLEVSSSRPR